MEIKKSVEKLDKYVRRVEKGKAQKVKPSHVKEVLTRLKSQHHALRVDLRVSEDEAERARIGHDIDAVQEQIDRAEWLLSKLAVD